MLKVAYLGPEGTYSEEAARNHFGSAAEYLPFASIDAAIQSVEQGMAEKCIVPVENSTEGAVGRTLDLLLQTRLTIIAEVMLPIHHQLLTSAKELASITEVLAHAQSLAQCSDWLEKHLPNAAKTAVSSNAKAVATIVADTHSKRAAIAGVRAAAIYDMPMLAQDIEDQKNNTTRFFVLGKDKTKATNNDKTSFVCSVPNSSGALYELLGILKRHGVNMTKLESRPAVNSLWEYVFFIDVDGHIDTAEVALAAEEMQGYATFVKTLGSYPKA